MVSRLLVVCTFGFCGLFSVGFALVGGVGIW